MVNQTPNQNNLPIEELLRLILVEAYQYRNVVVGLFVIISLSVIAVGLNWPKVYTSTTTVYVEQRSIIQPLMDGAAVTTTVQDRARIAQEIIFSRKIIGEILEYAGWMEAGPSDIDQERIAEEIRGRSNVGNVGANLIKIAYRDTDPERAYKTAEKFAELLISESAGNKSRESRDAFEFIAKQTGEYHEKLLKAEMQLKEFRSKSVGTRPATESEVSSRINDLRRRIETSTMDLDEAKIKRNSLEKQLAGEAEVTASITREGQLQSRIAELNIQLDTLRLTYYDTYPDVVRINQQINDLKKAILDENERRESAKRNAKSRGRNYVDEGVRLNPLYQKLRQELSITKTTIATLQARVRATKKLLNSELERARSRYGGEATLVELTRDYEVNRDIYQDLLRRRENARVSRNLDQEQRGLTMKIQEPAALPLRPSGLRFMHFLIGGLLLGILAPFAVITALIFADPRVRFSSVLSDKLRLPVMAVIPYFPTPTESKLVIKNLRTLASIAMLNIGIIAWVAYMKFSGTIL